MTSPFRSVAWTGTRFRFDELLVPEPGPGEVRVRVAACSVCVTEVHFVDGFYDDFPLPERLGHEYGGIVEAVGPGVERLAVGEQVGAVGGWGGFGEIAIGPAAKFHPLGGGLPSDHACFLEPLSGCVKAIRKGNVSPGTTVLVTGAGSNGLLLAQLARRCGAGRTIVSEPDPDRRALALQLGVDEALDPRQKPLPESLGGACVDVAFETAGHLAALRDCLDAVVAGGRVVIFGMTPDSARLDLPLHEFHLRDLALEASMGYDAESTAAAVSLLPSLTLEPLISHRFALEEIVSAFDVARRGTGLKALVYPAGGGATS